MARCNPFGYATDAGPKHLMGGFYGPEYAGRQTTTRDGIHGPAVCENTADRRMRMVCRNGHEGPVMDLCGDHAAEIMRRMADCCTRCVWPSEARGIDEGMNYVMRGMQEARVLGDMVRLRVLSGQLDDLRAQMDDLVTRKIIAKVPLKLVEVS
jgi:hypothetical protein